MPAAGQGHIPPLHLSILNYSSCCLLVPRRTPRAHQYSRTQDVIWAVGPCSGGRWSLLPGGSLWCPCTTYLHLIFIQFSFRGKSSQPSSPNLISLPSQTGYRLRTHSQAAERWQDGLGLQRFCSRPPRAALLSPAQARTSGEEVSAAAGALTNGLLGGQSSFCITGRLRATPQTTPGLRR